MNNNIIKINLILIGLLFYSWQVLGQHSDLSISGGFDNYPGIIIKDNYHDHTIKKSDTCSFEGYIELQNNSGYYLRLGTDRIELDNSCVKMEAKVDYYTGMSELFEYDFPYVAPHKKYAIKVILRIYEAENICVKSKAGIKQYINDFTFKLICRYQRMYKVNKDSFNLHRKNVVCEYREQQMNLVSDVYYIEDSTRTWVSTPLSWNGKFIDNYSTACLNNYTYSNISIPENFQNIKVSAEPYGNSIFHTLRYNRVIKGFDEIETCHIELRGLLKITNNETYGMMIKSTALNNPSNGNNGFMSFTIDSPKEFYLAPGKSFFVGYIIKYDRPLSSISDFNRKTRDENLLDCCSDIIIGENLKKTNFIIDFVSDSNFSQTSNRITTPLFSRYPYLDGYSRLGVVVYKEFIEPQNRK
ncbi:MAG: hypothetical protein U0U66_04080 [Cytophagaceae bacterium]